MNKLHSLALCALVTPAITLGAGSALAQQSTDRATDRAQQSSTQAGMQTTADGHKSGMQNRDYISAVPAKGREASNLMGAEVKTTRDEEVGSVSDLIIDHNGQVLAIVVGVGGFLGMGEKDVAIGWGHIDQSGAEDDQELRIDVTREDLQAAPEFEKQH